MVFLIKNSHYSLKCQNRSFLMLVLIIISVFSCLVNSNLNIISFFLTRSHFWQKKWKPRAAVHPSHVLNKIWSLHLPSTSHRKDASQPSVPVSYALPNLSSWNTRAQFSCWTHAPLLSPKISYAITDAGLMAKYQKSINSLTSCLSAPCSVPHSNNMWLTNWTLRNF